MRRLTTAPIRFAVPFYCHPVADAAQWAALTGNPQMVDVAVLNVDNGPGRAPDPDYLRALRDHPMTPWAGYVHFDYGRRPADVVIAEAHRWMETYGIRDIMLDAVPSDAVHAARLHDLVGRIRTLGARRVLGNPGRPVDDILATAFDILCESELAWADYATHQQAGSPQARGRRRRTLTWHLIHSCPPDRLDAAVLLARDRGADLVWVTTGTLDNPWRSIPSRLLDPDA